MAVPVSRSDVFRAGSFPGLAHCNGKYLPDQEVRAAIAIIYLFISGERGVWFDLVLVWFWFGFGLVGLNATGSLKYRQDPEVGTRTLASQI